MGLNSWLNVVVDGETVNLQFQWGHCRESQHQIGDTISWEGMTRPTMADGRVEVAGCWCDGEGLNDREFNYRYFAIAIEHDRIIGLREIDEEESERLDRSAGPAMGWED